ncbi:hypothetical protein PSPO01_02638 [Paraphaeosphaeria sporulosa]
MVKDSSLRLFMAVLLAIQAVCWSLTLLDLISPGKPLSLLRTSGDIMSQMIFQQSYTTALRWNRDLFLRL